MIEQVCRENDIDINAFTIVDEKSDVKCVQLAVAAVVAGVADVLMKGLVSTDKYMRGILNKEAGLFPEGRAEPRVGDRDPPYHKLITVSDVAVIPLPDFQAEAEADRLPRADGQAAGHRYPEDRLHRTVGAAAAERDLVHRGRNPSPRWATAASWAT